METSQGRKGPDGQFVGRCWAQNRNQEGPIIDPQSVQNDKHRPLPLSKRCCFLFLLLLRMQQANFVDVRSMFGRCWVNCRVTFGLSWVDFRTAIKNCFQYPEPHGNTTVFHYHEHSLAVCAKRLNKFKYVHSYIYIYKYLILYLFACGGESQPKRATN